MDLPERCINLYAPAGWRKIRKFMDGAIPAAEWDSAATIPSDEIYEDQLEQLLPSYDYLRCELRDYIEAEELSFLGVHCCRPLSPGDYYSEGFAPLSDGHAKRLIVAFGNGKLTDDEVGRIMRALDLGCRSNVVMFAVGYPEDVDDNSRHYLLIGPEFFCEIKNDCAVPEELRLKFSAELERSIIEAIPTMFIVAVPFRSMSDRGKDWVVNQLVVGHLWLRSWIPKKPNKWGREMSMECSKVVPPDAIIGHVHPKELVDFFHGPRRVTKGHKTSCDRCR